MTPLQQVLEIKQRRVEAAELVVQTKLKALEAEKEKLKKAEEARDAVKQHYRDKLKQFREELDRGTTSPKILQIKGYIKVVEERLAQEEKKVKEQQVKVDNAAKELEAAKEQLRLKRLEVDKLVTHRKTWERELRKEMEIMEEREMDELGTVIHQIQERRKEDLLR
jgi:flagellar export protein FliJ